MNRKVFAPDNEASSQTRFKQDEAVDCTDAAPIGQAADDLKQILQNHPALVSQLALLTLEEKVALMHHWMAQLDREQLQALVDSGQQQIAAVPDAAPPTAQSQTRLLLKKDYTYQQQGLSQPTQYYVYLRRRKPKLDRYIGTLFYIPQGCALSYKVDASGRILFDPPHNLFQLKDPQNPAAVRIVRLLYLEPPPPDYTFTKQQHDSPQIRLCLEELDPLTHQVLSQTCYPFPFCMYEGGPLDRYRWDVSVVSAPAAQAETAADSSPLRSAANPARRLRESGRSTQFFLTKPEQAAQIVERMRLWINWSDRALPQSRWEMVQSDLSDLSSVSHAKKPPAQTFTLQHSDSRRIILSFQPEQAIVSLNHSLPVVMKWFQDLGLAISETQNQRQYTAAELKLAHSLFVNMSLSQTDPLVVLKQLFGVSFTKTAPGQP